MNQTCAINLYIWAVIRFGHLSFCNSDILKKKDESESDMLKSRFSVQCFGESLNQELFISIPE